MVNGILLEAVNANAYTSSDQGNINTAAIVVILGIIVAFCSIISFYLGRKKEAREQGTREGVIDTNFKNIFDQLLVVQKTIERFTERSERTDEKRDQENKAMIIAMTKLESSYSSLHKRVDKMEQQCRDTHAWKKDEGDR